MIRIIGIIVQNRGLWRSKLPSGLIERMKDKPDIFFLAIKLMAAIEFMQVLLTWHITNSVNEWGILNGSLAGVFMILFSYHRLG